MNRFSIRTAFTQADLDRLHAAGSNVVVAKPTAGHPPEVAWIVFPPSVSNTVEWEENYGIYASTAGLQNGSRLTQIASTYPAELGMMYKLDPYGSMIQPRGGAAPGAYTIQNSYGSPLSFGLFQNADVNGTQQSGGAVSATRAPSEAVVTMNPGTVVYLWVQSQIASNTVVANIVSPTTQVTLSASSPSASLAYDAATGRFISR